jgi:hypothetical protein
MDEIPVVSREVIDGIVAELERLQDDATDRWAIPKRDDPQRDAVWQARAGAYRDALKLFGAAGLAPKYAPLDSA